MDIIRTMPVHPAQLDDYMRELFGKGKTYLPADLPDDLHYGEPGHCFDNCLLAALRSDGKYRYCEGIGIMFDEAFVHAWLTDGEHAYDLTWRAVYKDGKTRAAPAVYKGVELDTEACARMVRSSGYAGIVGNRTMRPGLYKEVLKRSGLL